MQSLTAEERRTLLDIVGETHGAELTRDAFAEAILDLFENISGFETISPAKASRIVNQLWSTYHGQEARED